jgi:DNA recombination protein RmuC
VLPTARVLAAVLSVVHGTVLPMDLTTVLVLVLAVAAGLALGLLLGRSTARADVASSGAEAAALREQVRRLEQGRDTERDVAVAVAPLRESLAKVESHLRQLETARVSAYAALTEQVSMVRETSADLRAETAALVTALRAPQVRGRWGEMQLRRVVEVAGMLDRCDFSEQVSVRTTEGVLRPDLVVRLAGGKNVVVDAKVALSAYLEAAEASDADVREGRLHAHARQLRAHVDGLAAKSYWAALAPSPEFVVLFVPGEAFLAPALERDPALLEDAMRKGVVVATPTTLLAMLRTIAYAWQQEALTDNAREVFELGSELYRRLGTMGGHVDKLGRSLRRAVEDYNATVGSLERTVLSQARRMAELEVTDRELASPGTVEEVPRALTARELIEAAERQSADRRAS